MAQSLSQVYAHLVFSTKKRECLLVDAGRDGLHSYVGGVLSSLGCQPIEINSEPDHIHILTGLSRTVTIADTVREIKLASGRWLQQSNNCSLGFKWQSGYGAFSVGRTELAKIKKYIRNQRQHHRSQSFQDEFRTMCTVYGLALDERFAWD
jgi:REP element-mobilizing transposase RayT